MLIVTGGAGFIGSNLIHELNNHGIGDILIVDSLANANKFRNLHVARYTDHLDKREFRRAITENVLGIDKIDMRCLLGTDMQLGDPIPLSKLQILSRRIGRSTTHRG